MLVDLARLESMSLACVPEFGRGMEIMDQRGVELVVRVIPDPTKDIGLNILMHFHYKQWPRVVVCENMIEAGRILEL